MSLQLIRPEEVVNGGIYSASPFNARFDPKLIQPHITTAEERALVPFIGEDMYLDMISKRNPLISNYNPPVGPTIQKFPNAPDVAYETLWTQYLLNFIGYAVYAEAIPFISIQVGTNGVTNFDGQNFKPASKSDMQYLRNDVQEKIRALESAILRFICKNIANYPLFPKDKCNKCSGSPSCACGNCGNGIVKHEEIIGGVFFYS